ncbi:MAG: serine/threonine protein phosphatase, partial [Flavobacteriaceae bacterium]
LDVSHNCIFIRGNHDQLAHDWLRTNEENKTWLLHGGLATKASYEKKDGAFRERHMDFFEGLRNYYLDMENRLFLHAGFTNMHGVEHEYFPKMFYWDRTLWEMALSLDPKMSPGDTYYPKRLKNYREIYIGHTPVTRIGKTVPHKAANVWNIDTGAAFKGPLSVVDVDTKEVWQSDPVHTFYPDERGRN